LNSALNYVSSTGSITIVGLTAAQSWSAFEPVSVGLFGVAYIPAYIGTTYTGSGYWGLGSTNSIEIVYTEYAWVTIVTNPQYASGVGLTQATGWYQLNTMYPISAAGSTTYTFSSWMTSGKNITLGSSSSSSTTMTVKGPATLTANYGQPTSTFHFLQYGLPKGTNWGVEVYSGSWIWYTSSTQWINITSATWGSYNWYALTYINAGTGAVWNPSNPSGSIDSPFQTYQAVVYAEQFSVAFAVSGTGAGTTNPSTTAWYWVGTVLPIMAENTSSGAFSSWSATTGTATITSTTSSATFAKITGAGTITARFT